jgi:hypothetical protein
MKKFLMFLCAVTLVFGMVETASAIPYTDTYDAGHYYMDPWGGKCCVVEIEITPSRSESGINRARIT